MPQTPKVRFNFKNLNVQNSVPLLGVTNVVARTTKGEMEKPSEIISSYSQFQRLFGSEIVPDGSVSNIKKALDIGSRLRVTRVAGEGATYGWATPLEVNPPANTINRIEALTIPTGSSVIVIKLTNPDSATTDSLTIPMVIRTREAGSPVLDNTGLNLNRPFYLKVTESLEPNTKVSISQYSAKNNTTDIPLADSLIADTMLYSAIVSNNNPSIDVSVLDNFINNSPNVTLEVWAEKVVGSGSMAGIADSIKQTEDVIAILRQFNNWNSVILVGKDTGDSLEIDTISDTNCYMGITEGSAGVNPTADSWIAAYKASKEYYEAYQVILSHIHQHLPSNYQEVYIAVADDVHKTFEQMLYIEVPKYLPQTRTPASPEEVLSALKTMVKAVGEKKEVAYFGGGINYYNELGSLQKCDLLGSVIGLGDTSASTYGPWYSFSGMNRGVISDAQGPVMKNLGGPGEIEMLNRLAEWYMNLFVIKDTRAQGKRTMLWHGFTSNPTNDSEKFISIVRLNLYLKKNLRPILESYIEEPNTFETWKKIYLEAKNDVMDDLVSRNAMTSYEWLGDQDASSYEDLQVNSEADVRNGKYHIILKYREIVPMQDIEMDVVIDIAVNKKTGDISISQSN